MKDSYILGDSATDDSIIAISYTKKKYKEAKNVKSCAMGPVDFETALSATGFGKYNYQFLCVCIPSAFACVCATTTMSFILSEAQCDLSLTLENKGMLNAITYIGMITSAFLWGTIGDKYGRRIVLLYACSFDGIVCLCSCFVKSYWMLLIAKFISGFLMCGPNAVFISYISEFHCSRHRPKILMVAGTYFGFAKVSLPLLAWFIMPLKLNVVISQGVIELASWQIYLILFCIPSIVAGILHYILPETPKYLMTSGRHEEALDLFRKMYAKNTGNPPESLPFSELIDETHRTKEEANLADEVNGKSKIMFLLNILNQIKLLFTPPYLKKTFLLSGIQFGGLLGGNTLRLWLPQFFTTMNEYEQKYNYAHNGSICDMLDYSPKITDNDLTYNDTATCTVPEVDDEVYINNMIVPLFSIVGYFLIGAVINVIGKKTLLVLQFLLSAALIIANYWAITSFTTVILSSLFLTFNSICATTAVGIGIELFPTDMRTMAISIALLCGRIGSILGNTLFPVLLYSGCLPPFLFIGGFSFICGVLSIMLPSTEKKPLK